MSDPLTTPSGAFLPTSPAPLPTPRESAAAATAAWKAAMHEGTRLHAAGRAELALLAFEQAAALRPEDLNSASACATMLSLLNRPQAAFRKLLALEDALLQTADGAANLAITAEASGDGARARAAYERALALDPNHLRALNNTALLAAADGKRDLAIERARRCVALDPSQPSYWGNLSDMLCGARRYGEAVIVLDTGLARFPKHPDLTIRLIAALAFDGEVDKSQAVLKGMDAATCQHFVHFIERNAQAARQAPLQEGPLAPAAPRLPDAWQMFCQQAFNAMTVCDWGDNDRLTALLRAMVAEAARDGRGRDWRDAQLYGLMLDIPEDEMARMRRLSIVAIGAELQTRLPPFAARRTPAVHRDSRIHVGLAVQSLRDERHATALRRQLELHDTERFAIHIYSPTRQPRPGDTERLQPWAHSVVEIAHMTDVEAAGRMRLDQLDVFMDMAFDTPWCRPEIVEMRVAPVQLRQLTWHRHHPPRPCDYNISDTFVHPDGLDLSPYGAVVRLPHTAFLATLNDVGDSGASTGLPENNEATEAYVGPDASREARRLAAGVAPGMLVLCASVPSVMLDPASFAAWMRLLHELPQAVLWLPAYSAEATANLRREAGAAGVDGGRLHFSSRMPRSDILARLQLADLFLDTLRFNANQGMADALCMGVPAISCAGNGMAPRLGGSILRAAGLPEGVVNGVDAYVAEALRLGRDPAALAQWRERLAAQRATAPLFDLQPRVREWEAAWAYMVERHRAGLAPVAFDVASRTPASA